MTVRTITAHSNPLIKRLRGLHDKKNRQAEGLFLAEGMRIVAEAVEAGQPPRYLVLAEDQIDHPLARKLIAATQAAAGEVIATSADILNKLSRKDNPQSLIGIFQQTRRPLATFDRSAAAIWIVLESIRDPGNLGTILRTADAIGAGGVILLDQCCDPFSVEAVRATMGALFTMPIAQAPSPAFLDWLRAGSGVLAGAVVDATVDYQAVDYPSPTFVLMGNEQSGLPAGLAAACDHRVRIPMSGKADSLNVAVATAVLAYEVYNQQRRRTA